MKRAILILTLLTLAVIFSNRFSALKPMTKKHNETSSKINAAIRDRRASDSQKTITPPQNETTNVSEGNEEDLGKELGLHWRQLSREEVDAYLKKVKRSPEGLLNAFLETCDTNLLAEAFQKYPDNPIVLWTMLSPNSQTPPEERPQWLEKLKAASPDNALPNYLSALDNLKAGNVDKALVEMDAASKKNYNSFDIERMQSREEMYLLAGLSPVDAKGLGIYSLLLPNLSEMKTLSQEIGTLQQKYKTAGDSDSAQQLGILAIEASHKLTEGNNPVLLNQFVGFSMENRALKNLDADTYYDFLGKTAGERIQEIKDQKSEISDTLKTFDAKFSGLSDSEKMIYFDRSRLYGEINALHWLKRNYASEAK